jgi:serine/threonine protein kinase
MSLNANLALLSDVLSVKANILIDQDRHARLADFGLLTIVSDHTNFMTSSSTLTGGTIRWMSPELLHPEQFGSDNGLPTKQSDCYALGMVVYEVLAGQSPFTPFKDYIVMRMVTDGELPGRPEGAKGAWFTDDLWRMLCLCWATHSQSRPSIETVLECLERISSAWKPLPPQVNEGSERNENDSDRSGAGRRSPTPRPGGSALTVGNHVFYIDPSPYYPPTALSRNP